MPRRVPWREDPKLNGSTAAPGKSIVARLGRKLRSADLYSDDFQVPLVKRSFPLGDEHKEW